LLKILRFWWRCLTCAWRGSFSLANAWQGLWGTLLLWAYGYWREISVTIPDKVDSHALIFLSASLGVTWFGVFLFQFSIAPAKLYWTEHKRANSLSEELGTLKSRDDLTSAGPSWTISELFLHIDPDFLEENRWEKIGDELRDDLSAGRLCMWGRLIETDSGSWVGPRAALKPIEKTYWYNAYFTYFFFHKETSDGVHCFADRKTGRPAYTDLQVNRRQALALWPGEPDDVADSYPNVRVADSGAVIDLFNGSERTKLVALLAAGKISTWARRGSGTANDLVKRDGGIWNSHSLAFYPKGVGPVRTINQTFLRASNPLDHGYYDVCLNYAQLRRVWPALSISRTKCDIL
jgi:hypothetical protein